MLPPFGFKKSALLPSRSDSQSDDCDVSQHLVDSGQVDKSI